MANPEHLAKLNEGVEAWNRWRKENPDVAVDLKKANLRKKDLRRAKLNDADLYGANLEGAILSEADLRGANLALATLAQVTFRESDLDGANLSGADLHEASFSRANLCGANLHKANLSKTDFFDADLANTNLIEAKLVDARLYRSDFRKADLRGANLQGADLGKSDLRNANLSEADLYQADLNGTLLIDADLSRAHLEEARVFGADLLRANLNGADLSKATLLTTNLRDAILTECHVYGISAWNLCLEGAVQSNLVITPHYEPTIQVDNLEIAQFVYLLLNNDRIQHVINTITSKAVLILGRFSKERKAVLDALRDELRNHDFLPILFDFDKPDGKDLTGTITTLANMARFVIADLTEPSSVPHELAIVIPTTVVPLQTILLNGQREYAMFGDLKRRYHWVLKPYQYESEQALLANLRDHVIAPAEAKVIELRQK